MAVWQFDLNAVHSATGTALPAPSINLARAWLEQEFEPAAPMTPGWLVYGQVESNRIDLLEDADGSGELYVRIDARTDAESFINQVAVLMLELKCALYSPELDRFVSADAASLKEALMASTAWRYSLDPASAVRGQQE